MTCFIDTHRRPSLSWMGMEEEAIWGLEEGNWGEGLGGWERLQEGCKINSEKKLKTKVICYLRNTNNLVNILCQ